MNDKYKYIRIVSQIPELLFDEEYANLFFEWEDGTRIPAHRAIVLKRAEYFK